MSHTELPPLDVVLDPICLGLSASKHAAKVHSDSSVFRLAAFPEVNPLALASALDEATAREWHDWEPEMLRDFLQLPEDAVQQLDKVMAIQVGITNPDVFSDWDLFLHVCSAYNHRRASFEWIDQPSYIEAAWTCVCLRNLNGEHQFGPGVIRFLGAVCILDGLVFFPWTGGEGISLCEGVTGEWASGIVDPELCKLSGQIRDLWEAKQLQTLEPGEDIQDDDPLHAQLEKIVAAQAYFRSQRPRFPDQYEDIG